MSEVSATQTAKARTLRRPMPPAELAFWRMVQNRGLGGWKFRRQHPIDRYFADFACVEAKLVVELDGVSHEGRKAYDAERTATLEACGWRVIRYPNATIMSEWSTIREQLLAELNLARS